MALVYYVFGWAEAATNAKALTHSFHSFPCLRGGHPPTNKQVIGGIVKTEGAGGLFKGIIPRIGLGIWQTLFMVTGAKLLKQYL